MFNYWAKPEHTLDLCQILNNDIAEQIKQNRVENEKIGLSPKSFYGFGNLIFF
jgi:hypothetical protein